MASTPNATNHEDLAPKASRFVDVGALPWEKTRFPGIETKTLLVDKVSGAVTVLFKMAPGAKLPDHEHPLIEQTFVLDGALADHEGTCTAGNFVWRPAGSRHEAWSPEGGLMIGIFQVPNKFFDEGGRVSDILEQEWNQAWGEAGNLRAAG